MEQTAHIALEMLQGYREHPRIRGLLETRPDHDKALRIEADDYASVLWTHITNILPNPPALAADELRQLLAVLITPEDPLSDPGWFVEQRLIRAKLAELGRHAT